MNINQEIISQKIVSIQSLKKWLNEVSEHSPTIVFTNGCFDIVHRGHIDYLSKAAEFGDFLVVGLNSDLSVARIKGSNRPVQDELGRAWLLASLFFVDAVVLFDEDTPYELIREIEPDVLIKGSDYAVEDIVGADIVLEKGGRVMTLDFLPGYSTSDVIRKITMK